MAPTPRVVALCAVAASIAMPPGRWLLLALFKRLQLLRVISRHDAAVIYDSAARTPNAANDAESGYGGPASDALARLGGIADADGGEDPVGEYGCGRWTQEGPQPASAAPPPLVVVEYGCGRGALARALLRARDARGKRTVYIAFDQSEAMVARARDALAPWVARGVARVVHVPSGEPADALAHLGARERARGVDRVVSTYVLDLLSDTDISRVLRVAHGVLRRETGRMCVSGITFGAWRMPITVYWAARWEVKRLWRPRDMGGCRPQELARDHLPRAEWRVTASEKVLPRARPWMCSEVIIAEPIGELPSTTTQT